MGRRLFIPYLVWPSVIGINVWVHNYGFAACMASALVAFLANEIVIAIKEIR